MLAVDGYMQDYKSRGCPSCELLIFAPPLHYIIDNGSIDSSKRLPRWICAGKGRHCQLEWRKCRGRHAVCSNECIQ